MVAKQTDSPFPTRGSGRTARGRKVESHGTDSISNPFKPRRRQIIQEKTAFNEILRARPIDKRTGKPFAEEALCPKCLKERNYHFHVRKCNGTEHLRKPKDGVSRSP